MDKKLRNIISILIFLVSIKAHAQFTFSDIKYWIGSGTDSSMLVIDFHDGSFWDTCYAWGYLHNAGATGEDMLNDISAADINLTVGIAGGFLNDISYGSHSGVNGTGSFYWSTWDGTTISNLVMNSGISAALTNGTIFGCSFTDFAPALPPGVPIPAFDPYAYSAQDVMYWIGSGTDTTLLVIDFIDGSGSSSFLWGYLHNSGATGEDLLNAVDAADPNLNVVMAGGFLNDITYNSFSGIAGAPHYWGTWSAGNPGNWDMNMGISTVLGNGDIYGCSYTDFAPALRPGYPSAASIPTPVADTEMSSVIKIYPNPPTDYISVFIPASLPKRANIKIFDALGKTVYAENINSATLSIPVTHLADGLYHVLITGEETKFVQHFIKP